MIKRHISILAMFTLIVSGVFAENNGKKELNILFIGNSFTFRNSLPVQVKKMLEAGQPGLKVNAQKVVYGGQDLFKHDKFYFSDTFIRSASVTPEEIEKVIAKQEKLAALNSWPQFYLDYCKGIGGRTEAWQQLQGKIKRGIINQKKLLADIRKDKRTKWDYVVLQSWQDITPDMNIGYPEYAKKFAAIAAGEKSKTVLYITAPYAQNAKPVRAPIEPKKTVMELDVVKKLAQETNVEAVIPVPLAINNIQRNGTDLTFRYVNDFHPNQYCALLTASMFYAALTGKSPEGIKLESITGNIGKGLDRKPRKDKKGPDGKETKVTFEAKTRNYLQKAAYEAVTEFNKKQH